MTKNAYAQSNVKKSCTTDIEKKFAEFLIYLEKQSESDFEKWLTGVNIFEVLGITSAEIRHSRILAWLLDPRETHKMGDTFLKKLLLKTIDRTSDLVEIGAIEVLLKDFSKAQVFRESQNNIDVFYTNAEHQFNIVIENKTFTSDHDNQLTKYRRYVENWYPNYRNLYIYLTPRGDSPQDASEAEKRFWKLLSYQDILDILNDLWDDVGVDNKVRYILKEYSDNIRRNILNDTELKELSAEIYFKYKEVLDLIIDNRPDTLVLRERLIEVLRYLDNHNKLVFNEKDCSKTFLRFRTAQLDKFLSNQIDDSQREWSTGSSYFYEITYNNFQVDVYLSIYSKNQTEEQSKKFGFLLANDRYSKSRFNTSNKFLNLDCSEENILQEGSVKKLRKFMEENLQQIDEFEKDFISRWDNISKGE